MQQQQQRCVNEIAFGDEVQYRFESELIVSHVRPERNGSQTVVASHTTHVIRRTVALSLLDRSALTPGANVSMLFGLRALDDSQRRTWTVLFLQNCAGQIDYVYEPSRTARTSSAADDNADDDIVVDENGAHDGDYDQWPTELSPQRNSSSWLFRELRSLLTLFSISTTHHLDTDDKGNTRGHPASDDDEFVSGRRRNAEIPETGSRRDRVVKKKSFTHLCAAP
jgi:hypothetical protein